MKYPSPLAPLILQWNERGNRREDANKGQIEKKMQYGLVIIRSSHNRVQSDVFRLSARQVGLYCYGRRLVHLWGKNDRTNWPVPKLPIKQGKLACNSIERQSVDYPSCPGQQIR
ncbi:hypothetical protein TNCT_205071 [Trichonephila clavata]|uniref:Uncharacterized protein n=1 Tax=Trichonephila clavata TaxID=2740835 RepID=A0A8X6GPT9_TRICU|nr:hypothetical protein TNCT_205071 [Trichonephila clavata]